MGLKSQLEARWIRFLNRSKEEKIFPGKTRILATLLLMAQCFSISGFAREPRPFVEPYQDGIVLLLWEKLDDTRLLALFAQIKKAGTNHLTVPIFGCQTD